MSNIDPFVANEVARRRTFAIISHPDAGKTTLTEKLLLYGGCLDVAGAVRGRKSQRAAKSDWMELERQRGISVSSTVLSFDFDGFRVNLLDTPGHQDFSEDTYRTLMAADCAVMVIDLAKGVEAQTEKLFRVCAMRKIPVLTFVNKVDRPGQEPLAILANIEEKLGLEAIPFNWPVGSGGDFRGIVETDTGVAHVFEKSNGQSRVAFQSYPVEEIPEADCEPAIRQQAAEELELVRTAGPALQAERFLRGEMTPVFFGSALNNYGVEHFLRGFLKLCPPPGDRISDQGKVPAARREFSGFIFKIQANLDPRHRDRVAFMRICSGRFQREMEIVHPRTGKKLRLARAHRLFAQDRETVDEAFPGDIVGLVNPGEFRLGDTICEGAPVNFHGLPQFPPEFFATLHCTDTSRRKQFDRGLQQLVEEGAIQLFTSPDEARREFVLAAVGELQFDVVRFRLETEYNATTTLTWLPYKLVRWMPDIDPRQPPRLKLPYGARRVIDQNGMQAILFESIWEADHTVKENPSIRFSAIGTPGAAEFSDSKVAG